MPLFRPLIFRPYSKSVREELKPHDKAFLKTRKGLQDLVRTMERGGVRGPLFRKIINIKPLGVFKLGRVDAPPHQTGEFFNRASEIEEEGLAKIAELEARIQELENRPELNKNEKSLFGALKGYLNLHRTENGAVRKMRQQLEVAYHRKQRQTRREQMKDFRESLRNVLGAKTSRFLFFGPHRLLLTRGLNQEIVKGYAEHAAGLKDALTFEIEDARKIRQGIRLANIILPSDAAHTARLTGILNKNLKEYLREKKMMEAIEKALKGYKPRKQRPAPAPAAHEEHEEEEYGHPAEGHGEEGHEHPAEAHRHEEEEEEYEEGEGPEEEEEEQAVPVHH